MLFNCHSCRFVCRPMPYVCPAKSVFTPGTIPNSLQPARPAVASRSCSSHGPVSICVIVTGSITTLKYDNIICNNKNKLARCHLCTTNHRHTHRRTRPCEHDVSLQFVSQTQAGSDFRPCGLRNIYRSTHQAVCHYCLQESDLWGFLGRRGKGDMVWMSFREKLRGGQATVAIK